MKTKYTSQTAAKPSWKNAILLAITALALLASPGVALADCTPVTNWTASSGSWFTSGNWDNGVPNSGTGAVVSNGGKAQISGSLPQASACSLTVNPGTVSVSNQGSLTVTYGIAVGGTSATATSLLAVNSQSSATVTNGNVQVNSSGTLTGNATVNSDVAVEGGGTLSPNFTLTINGNLSFATSTATMQCNVIPSNSGSDAHVTGTATLTGHLSVTMTGTFSSGTNRYTLLQADGGLNSTTFSTQSITYDPSQGFTPSITYSSDGKYVYLDLTWNQ
jgi:fibronectin-binding autotransporter adhesin